MDWHLREYKAVLKEQQVDPECGLNSADVEQRRAQFGRNELHEEKKRPLIFLLFDQFKEMMVLILLLSAIVALFLGEWIDALVILAIVILNALLGFYQEYRAEQAMAALKKLASPNAKVRRNGRVQTVAASELVPGDIVLIDAGDAITADMRLIQATSLRIQEASLTGESQPVGKHTDKLEGVNTPLGDRKNMAYLGTSANYGNGIGLVVATGMKTELGNIATLIQNVEDEATPLQRRMDQLGKILALIVLGIIVVVMLLGWLREEPFIELFLTAVAMAVAAIPEGLPAIVTIALSLGAQKMLTRRALIRKLPAVETLGSVTTICSDKTGTLTKNRMTVQLLDVANERVVLQQGNQLKNLRQFTLVEGRENLKSLEMLLIGGALCNDAFVEPDREQVGEWQTIGDPTEGALLVAAQEQGLGREWLNQLFPRVAGVPFSSERKRMTTVHEITDHAVESAEIHIIDPQNRFDEPYISFTKGALNLILPRCQQLWNDGQWEPLSADWRKRIEQAHDKMASQGLRVLGITFRTLPDLPHPSEVDSLEENLTFLGMVGMMDPPRDEVVDAVATCATAGIRPIMITGDHPITAKEIAKQLGIAREQDRVMTGPELELLSAEQLEQIVETVPIYARVSPEHKLNIVQALQNRGHVVAMTGDGVNDAPALRKSDIGVAMGITGTDVSKEASDIIILDDNFATIVAAVREGRTIYDNVRKFLQFILISNAGEVFVMLIAPFLGMPLPLIPLQILWINLVTDGLPGLALSVEPSEKNVMKRPPYAPNESVFSRGVGIRILWGGLLLSVVCVLIGYLGYSGLLPAPAHIQDEETFTRWWRTLVFTVLTLSQMGNALALRSQTESLWKIGARSNMLMVYAVLLTLILQISVIYVPFLQNIFETTNLAWRDLLICLVFSTLTFLALEANKLWQKGKAG